MGCGACGQKYKRNAFAVGSVPAPPSVPQAARPAVDRTKQKRPYYSRNARTQTDTNKATTPSEPTTK